MKKKEEKNGKNEKKNEFSTILGGVYVLGSFFLFSDDSVFVPSFFVGSESARGLPHSVALCLLDDAC